MVFQNILSNSIKYSNPGGEIFVTLYKDPNKNTLNIKFRDFGIGIPEGAKDRIFSKMFRADNVKDIGIDGTGLGLYIAKKTVEQSGGKIWFESKVGVGTCFYISLPLS